MSGLNSSKKIVVLGTAMWGWSISKNEAYSILENFLASGGSFIDTASNYPINKCKKDHGLALNWLLDWKKSNPHSKMSLIVKIGSKDNLGGPDIDLTPKNILETTKKMSDLFENSLSCISIHWDNRCEKASDLLSIDQTVEAMTRVHDSGLHVGFSGIKNPKQYYLSNPNLSDDWVIQVKENFINKEARLFYETYFPRARYLAYGINMGGVKLECLDGYVGLRKIKGDPELIERARAFIKSKVGLNPSPKNINQISIALAHSNPSLAGIVIGPSNLGQLEESIKYWIDLEVSGNSPTWLKSFS